MYRLTNRGVYLLIIKMRKNKIINVGALGKILFLKGYYLYVGSGFQNLHRRIERHLKKNKNLRWHIDYLLKEAEIHEVIIIYTCKKVECKIAQILSKKFKSVKNFGCSDCKCFSHLFYSKEYPKNLTLFLKGI